MSNLDKLIDLCKKQDRELHVRYGNPTSSLLVTFPAHEMQIDTSLGGTDTVEFYATALLEKLEKASPPELRVVQ